MISNLVPAFFVTILIALSFFFGLVVYMARKAARLTHIKFPPFWESMIVFTAAFILGSILFILVVTP